MGTFIAVFIGVYIVIRIAQGGPIFAAGIASLAAVGAAI